MLAEHGRIVEHIHTDAGWARAAADYAAGAARPVRLVTLTDATTTEGRSRAQAAAQQRGSPPVPPKGGSPPSQPASRLRRKKPGHRSVSWSPTCSATPRRRLSPAPSWSSGAGWLGLRSHPRPIGSVTYGGPAVPDWLDATLREIVGVAGHPPSGEAR